MTPTLLGRWQTRLFLLSTGGLLITLPFMVGLFGPSGPLYLVVLVWIAILGLGWDVVYHQIQQLRWDHDWPGVWQLFAGLWEAFFLLVLVAIRFPLLGLSADRFPWGSFLIHYTLVWITIFIESQTVMRILFPRWRFRGGQWL